MLKGFKVLLLFVELCKLKTDEEVAMNRVLERCIKMKESPRAVIRLCGRIGIQIVVLWSRKIEREVKDLELAPSVLDEKEKIRNRIIYQKDGQ